MNMLFLVNPVSGSRAGKKIADHIEQSTSIQGIRKQIVFTDSSRLNIQVASLAPARDIIVICGGDGTVSRVAGILSDMSQPPPMAVIPLGTGNDIARSLGWFDVWKNAGLDGFWAGLMSGCVRPVDVWEVSGTGSFLAYAGIGMDAKILRLISAMRKKIGYAGSRSVLNLMYFLCGLPVLCRAMFPGRRFQCAMKINQDGDIDRTMEMKLSQLIFTNMTYYGGGSNLCSSGRRGNAVCRRPYVDTMSDGKLEMYFSGGVSGFVRLILMRYPFAGRIQPYGHAEMMEMSFSSSLPVQLDGEWYGILEKDKTYSILRKRVLPFMIPPEDFRVREGRVFRPDPALLMEKITSPVAGHAANRDEL